MSAPDLDDDGQPVWDTAEGGEFPGGTRAVRRLGVGWRCETWLVWSVPLWCPVVLKLPRPHLREHPRSVTALRREVTALSGPPHPGLPRLIADGSGEALPHLLFEYLDGPDLDDVGDDIGPLPEGEAALLGVQLLSAVAAVHHEGLAHLDVKPGNVVLRDGKPLLIDFGSTRAIGSPQPPGRPIGTRGYTSPEQEACLTVSPAMDVYGVGATLHAVVTGHRPDAGGRSSPMLAGLLEPDPTRRLDLTEATAALLQWIPAEFRPWPEWADAYLGGA
ncbi:serine/threonine-protein kinase [Amycolatopsis thermophila]|uniref:non-specific serine/threonine protein kinase n=1 Tax=Amycolatopsis thermophila TaxID=206084 RepID=A0ABU0F3M8_9PSEU|nr:serine/threonine-protein kinase [Amycolatopsis thermophila]MDQ0382190.1 serine/threonine protein kinase [Amycolatopsis thermophila]